MAVRELKEIKGKLDKGVQPLNILLTKPGLIRVRRLAWVNPALGANSPQEQEIMNNLLEELKESGELLKNDGKSMDDLVKGFHYERNQIKSQIKSRVKLDLSQPPEKACEIEATLAYLQTHLQDSSEEITNFAFQLAYVLARYINCKCPVIGDNPLRIQKDAVRDTWEMVAKRVEMDRSSLVDMKGKIRAALARGFSSMEGQRGKKAAGSRDS